MRWTSPNSPHCLCGGKGKATQKKKKKKKRKKKKKKRKKKKNPILNDDLYLWSVSNILAVLFNPFATMMSLEKDRNKKGGKI